MKGAMPIKSPLVARVKELLKIGRIDAAEDQCRRIIQAGNEPWGLHLLGLAAQTRGRLDEAAGFMERSISLAPDTPEFHCNLGVVLGMRGRPDDATSSLRQAIRLRSDYFEAHLNLGVAMLRLANPLEAEQALRKALSLRPGAVSARLHMAAALRQLGRLTEAIESYVQIVADAPDHAQAIRELAHTYESAGCLEGTIDCFRRAVELWPDDSVLHGNYAFTLFYERGDDADLMSREHESWAARHADALTPKKYKHDNDRSPERQLRIGYLSADFREHSVARFLGPLVVEHDRNDVDVCCYSDVRNPDKVTARLKQAAEHWIDVRGKSDEEVAGIIGRDRIDVLIDPTGHMGGSRILVFARKPAPLQIAFPGYPGTCGLKAMDYLITDQHQDPPGLTDGHYCERPLYMNPSSRCYWVEDESPETSPSPLLANGYPTFASVSRPLKVTRRMVGLWCKIMRRVPDSRLLFLTDSRDPGEACIEHRGWFEEEEINPRRIRFVAGGGRMDYLRLFNEIDVNLDAFPYHGCTRTCDALWMGVPTVVLAGPTYISRVGVSILSQVGMREFIADSESLYVDIAVGAATDMNRIVELRQTLRERTRRSPLMDAVASTRSFERAVRGAWRRWCEEG